MPVNAEGQRNLLDFKPRTTVSWEAGDEGKVVLLVPKFRNKWAVKWFVPMLAKPTVRVKLDERGSFVWQRCDGNTTLESIGEEMSRAFSEPLETTYERLGKFIHQMARSKFLTLDAVAESV